MYNKARDPDSLLSHVPSIFALIAAAILGAGCAQMPETSRTGEVLAHNAWPTPTIQNFSVPTPPEPTPVPQVVMPAEPAQADTAPQTESARRAPRRATGPRAPVAETRPAAAPAASVAKAPMDLWQRLRNGYKMQPFENNLVGDWENYYASRADYFAQMIQNSSHFLYHIVTEVERRGMPMEIALLPMIESAFNPVAYSSAHASGIWQFIPSTGKNYGLKQNWWYDGRRDVIAATGAALDYLQTLYGMFNDWELALAAYNWGEGAVQRAIDRNQARGLPTDYQSLYPGMPAETRNYVPKLIAVKNLIGNPARYGLTLQRVPNEPYFEVVTVKRHIDVTLAARFADMSVDEFKFLNPAHNKRVINSDSAETIVLPKHKVATFMAAIGQHEDKPLVSLKTHTVRAGERPEAIAEQYGVSLAELHSLNNIGPRRRIVTGQTLMVPNLTDLQPALDDIPVAMAQAHPAPVPAYRRVTVVVRGQRRTITVAMPAVRQAHAAQGVRSPIRAAVSSKQQITAAPRAGQRANQKVAPAKAGMQKIVYQQPVAPAKANRR